MTSNSEIAELIDTGQVVWLNERYGARYVIDRPGLSQLVSDGYIPVVHAGQPEVIEAVKAALPAVRWTVAQLTTDLATARARIIARDTGDVAERLEARAATPHIAADATLDTSNLSPDQAASYIEAAVRLNAGSSST